MSRWPRRPLTVVQREYLAAFDRHLHAETVHQANQTRDEMSDLLAVVLNETHLAACLGDAPEEERP